MEVFSKTSCNDQCDVEDLSVARHDATVSGMVVLQVIFCNPVEGCLAYVRQVVSASTHLSVLRNFLMRCSYILVVFLWGDCGDSNIILLY